AGWAVGTTNLPNAVVVPAGDCATGSTKLACRTTTSVTPHFALSLAKSVATTSTGSFAGTASVTEGDTVWYHVELRNTGNATLTGVRLRDSEGLPAGQCPGVPATLAPSGRWGCTYFVAAAVGTTTNTVTVDTDQTSPLARSVTVTAREVPAPAIRI